MDIIQSKQIYYIDSSQRISGDSSNFSIPLDIPEQENFTHIVVMECIIPISYYLVNKINNTFILKEHNVPDVTIAVQAGNYNVNSFCVILQGLLNLYSLSGWKYSCSYNAGLTDNFDGLISINVTENNGFQPSIVFPKNSTVIEQFGLGDINNYDQTFQFTNNLLKSTNVCNFVNEPVIIVHSNISDNGSTDVLQAVYQANNYQLASIEYQATEALLHAKKLRQPKTKVASFSLTDVNNNPINLNGQNWTMSICIFKREIFSDWVKSFLKTIITS